MQSQRQTYNNNQAKVLERNPSGKLSYSPGHWKNYIAADLMRWPEESRSSYESGNRFSSPGNNSYYQQLAQASQREEKERKKEEMLKRVRQIQERVMPLIENDYNHKPDEDFSWRTKIEQKVAKLETTVDAIEKTLEIKLERQVLELEKKMQQKYLELEARLARPKN